MTREELCAKREEALNAYSHIGAVVSCERYGNGHINDTFLTVSESGKRYIFQRINHTVFPHPDEVMENITAVTEHIRGRVAAEGGDAARSTLVVVPTDAGAAYYKDSIGSFWRMYEFTEGTVAHDRAESIQMFTDCAEAFGRFQGWLSDFDASVLHEPIVNFHNTPVRYENLMRAIEKDPLGRVAEVAEEIAFVKARAEFVKTLENAREAGTLPLRVTHNDTKLNNILFDAATGKPVCVIDLDTVMPGYSVNDFGDSIRFGANTAAEDETDLGKVSLDLGLYRSYAEGFLRGCNGKLTENEVALMPIGARMMTLECGMRFLTDYIEGDTYFRIARPSHNLDRCRCQFALVADMERKENEMKLI
ncbi:MAG: aminoglycoside phosphotransferase family protein [Ruminococcaceae bacterium]|nr:aminoglycoside phosphotransferase family protein [Oscillospiraceae bacterium]